MEGRQPLETKVIQIELSHLCSLQGKAKGEQKEHTADDLVSLVPTFYHTQLA